MKISSGAKNGSVFDLKISLGESPTDTPLQSRRPTVFIVHGMGSLLLRVVSSLHYRESKLIFPEGTILPRFLFVRRNFP